MREYTDTGLCMLGNSETFELVAQEDRRQTEKWGFQAHTLFEWIAYTTEELGELSKAISEFTLRGGDKARVIKEAIQTATLCLKIAQMVKER